MLLLLPRVILLALWIFSRSVDLMKAGATFLESSQHGITALITMSSNVAKHLQQTHPHLEFEPDEELLDRHSMGRDFDIQIVRAAALEALGEVAEKGNVRAWAIKHCTAHRETRIWPDCI